LKEEPLSGEELQLFNRRDIILKMVITIPFFGISWRLWHLQIIQGNYYKELAKGNRIRLKSVPAPRGILYDRNRVILAKNIPAYDLMLVREDTKNIPEVLQKISQSLKISIPRMERALYSKRGVAKFQPIRIKKGLTHYQMAVISAYQEEFPGISIEVSPQRYYPLLTTGAHLFGYLTKINKKQLKALPLNKAKSGQRVGQEGVERIYNDKLIGIDGGLQIEVDSTGRIIKTLNSIDPIPGHDVLMEIDARSQEKVREIMGDHRGSAIVMDPHTGAVRAMVSLPSFDPNEFSQGISARRWKQLSNDPSHILRNKSIQGIYSPGSTFKMLVGIAALEEGIIDEFTEHECKGFYQFNRLRVHCWKRSGHGFLNIVGALENSCNVFFYKVVMELGVNKIKEYASRFGLDKLTEIDLLHEKSGIIPDKAWKRKRFKEKWYGGDTLPVGIGQGYVSVTPMQLITYINAIANGGYLVKPQLVASIEENPSQRGDEDSQQTSKPSKKKISRKLIQVAPETLRIIRRGMEQNVSGPRGTGKRGNSPMVPIAGKTGTTQVVSAKTRARILRERGSIADKYLDHAWFASYAPSYDPKISVVLLIENGKSGSNAAALTRKIIEYYFSRIEALPPQPEQPIPEESDTPDMEESS